MRSLIRVLERFRAMKQIFQSLKTGEVELVDIPFPNIADGQILIGTTRSLVSAGTEKMLIEFGKSNLLNKALNQPEELSKLQKRLKPMDCNQR